MVASTAVAAPRQMITSANVAALDPNQLKLMIATFNQLIVSQDWAGSLELESEMSAIAKTFESSDPGRAGRINYNLGRVHTSLGREGGIEEATLCYKKTIEMTKKTGDNDILSQGVFRLAECYVKMRRVDEAMDLCDDIGKESMEPKAILQFAAILQLNREPSRALEILEEYLYNIESSWDNQ